MSKNKRKNKQLKKFVRTDAWTNELTGLNVTGVDRKMGMYAAWSQIDENQADNLYAGDKTSQKIINFPVEEMLREGFKLNYTDSDKGVESRLIDRLDSLEFVSKITEALKWARLYGGAAIILGTSEGLTDSDYSEELDLDSISKLHWLLVANRWQLRQSKIQNDPSRPHYGEPEVYTYSDSGTSFEVHRSRLLLFHGVKLPRELYKTNGYWHDSVLNNLQASIANFNQSHDSLATIVTEILQTSLKIKDLGHYLGSGQGELIKDRLKLIQATRSIVNAIILDAEESFERHTLNVTGIDALVKMVANRLVADTEIPHTHLLGESPSGLGATGSSQMKQWNALIGRMQENDLKPQLKKLFKIIFRGKLDITSGIEPDVWDVDFKPLDEPTQKEIKEMEKTQAEIDQIYIMNQVLSPDEIAVSRFGQGYSFDTSLDAERLELDEDMTSDE